ncbi:MAG: hypothetical protein WA064_02685 [Candidatus Moraniibacteriota bacterium]
MQKTKIIKKIFAIAVLFLLAGFGAISFGNRAFADEVSKLEDKKENLVDAIADAQKELQTSKVLLNKNVVQVNTTKTVLQQTESDIARKQSELEMLSNRAKLNKSILENYLQQIYFSNVDPLVELAVTNRQTHEIAENFDQLLSIKERINITLVDISQNEEAISNVKSELADKKVEHEKLLQKQKAEQGAIVADINETTATLAELQKKFAKVQSDLNALMSASYDAKDIKDAVGFASDKTGVPKGVLYGFLTQESGRGKNVGQCTYADVEKVSLAGYKKYGKKYQASIDRLYYREKLFNNIIDSLGYKSKKVSCTIPFSSAGPNQGGAMGAAQFMSDTWGGATGKQGYVPQISSITGHSKPDPWNITDAVVAMALKVRNAGGTSDSAASIRKSTTSYYGAFSQGYYNTVLYWSKNYKTLL